MPNVPQAVSMSLSFRYWINDKGKLELDSPKAFQATVAAQKKKTGWLTLQPDIHFDADPARCYWFACIVPAFMEYMGHYKNDAKMKEYVSKEVLKEIGWTEERVSIRGVVQLEAKSISRGKVSKDQMSELIQHALQTAADLEIIIPDRESAQAQDMMAEAKR